MYDKPVAIVTGAARGIGRGISLALAENGFTVAAAATRPIDDEGVSAYIRELTAINEDCIYIQCDISDSESRHALIDAVYEKFNRLDTLVNNAGVAPNIRADLLEMSEESFDRLININLRGTFFLTQYAARRMSSAPTGSPMSIITTTSISAETVSVNRGEYCVSKAGLSMTTKLFAARLAEFGINVYELRPGIIETDMIAKVKDKYDALIENGLLPIKRMGRPEDVGEAAVALAKGYLRYSTGETINIDGGFHISRL